MCSAQKLKFQKESDSFLKTTKQRVGCYFLDNNISKFGNQQILKKNLVIALGLAGLYILALSIKIPWLISICFSLIGVLTIVLAINVVHDAVHGVAHSDRKINQLLMRQMDLLGPNSFIWKQRHKTGHHTFPNVLEHDPDLKQSALVRIFPNAVKLNFHRFQHIYVPILYSIYTINWVYIRDFNDVWQYLKTNKITKKEVFYFFLYKAIYLFIFIFFPIIFIGISWKIVLLSHLLMHISASYFLTIALVPSHVCEHSIFPLPDKNGVLPYSWSHHQVMTTSDYATESKVMTWVLGGFNHHIVHHLFPEISHVHYFQLTPIVRNIIKEYNLPYQHLDHIFDAYLSHFYLLKKTGTK